MKKLTVGFLILICLPIFLLPSVTQASLFDDFINGMNNTLQSGVNSVNNLISPLTENNVKNNSLTIESDIKLVSDGDVNKNGQIDAGDTVTFEYIVSNPTSSEYAFASIETNINKDQLNFVHNISGSASLSQENNTITIPNLRILPNTAFTIKFDARVNYFDRNDVLISTEPKLITSNRELLKQSVRVEKKAKTLKSSKMPSIDIGKEKQ